VAQQAAELIFCKWKMDEEPVLVGLADYFGEQLDIAGCPASFAQHGKAKWGHIE